LHSDGSWKSKELVKNSPDIMLTQLGCTAYIFYGCTVAGEFLPETFDWLKINLFKHWNDSISVALVLESIVKLGIQSKQSIFCENIRYILLKNQTNEGCWVSMDSDNLSGDIETTAFTIMALAHAFPTNKECLEAVQRGLDWILERRYGGWNSTRDTLYSSWAIGEVAHLLWKSKSTNITLLINDKVYCTYNYDPSDPIKALDTLYQMREIHIDIKNSGINTISVNSSNMETNISFKEKKFYLSPCISDIIEHLQSATTLISCGWPKHSVKVGDVVFLKISIISLQFLENSH